MAYKFTPATFDGVNINDGANYQSYFVLPEAPMQLVSRDPVELTIPGDYSFPQAPRAQPVSAEMTLHVNILALNQSNLNALRRVFDRYKGEVTLAITDESAATWNATVRVKTLTEKSTNMFVVQLYLSRPIFESATLNTHARTVTASPDNSDLSPSVGGTVRSYPTINLTPTAAKTNANDYNRRWQVTIAWRSELPGEDSVGNGYPIDIADGTLDTAAEVAAGRMQADGDDLRVYVDGVEFPRTLSGMNGANTKVWVPIHFSPGKSVTMAAAASGVSPADGSTWDVAAGQSLVGWPERGRFKIENETVWYGARTDTQFQQIDRGFANTTAAAHAAGTRADWVEHDIQMVSNYTGAANPPTASLAISGASTNLAHTYNGFFTVPGSQRYGQMLSRFTEDNIRSASLSLLESAGTLILADKTAGGLYYPYNNAELYVPCGVKVAASAVAFDVDDGNTGVASTYENADCVLSLRVYGIDIATGVEALLGTYNKIARIAGVAKTITPTAVLQRVRFNNVYIGVVGAGRLQTPVDTNIGTAALAGGTSIAQLLTLDQETLITAYALLLRENAGADTRDAATRLAYASGAANPDAALEVVNYVIPNADLGTAYKWCTVDAADSAVPAGEYALIAAGQAAGAGTLYWGQQSTINARGVNQIEAAGVWGARGYGRDQGAVLLGDGSVVQADAPLPLEGFVSVDNIVITFDDTNLRTPAILRSAQETIYILRGVLEHVDHAQTITVFYIAALNEQVSIDCKNKLVTLDSAKSRYAPGAVTPSDAEQWMHLKASGVAADNSFRYTEAGLGGGSSVSVSVQWRDFWG